MKVDFRNPWARTIILLLMFAVVITGCEAPGTASTASDTPITAANKPVAKKPSELKGTKVGVILETISHPIMQQFVVGIKKEADVLGLDVVVESAERKTDVQVQKMESFTSQKVGLIILQANNAAALSPSVSAAEAAGIPVITINQDVDVAHAGFVGMGHYKMGQDVAKGMAEQMGDKGNIVLIEGVVETGANIDRVAGFKDELKNHPNIKIIADQPADFDRKKGHDVFQTILKANSDIQGVFGVNDEMAIGAAQAAQEAGRTGIVFWGADGEKEMLDAIGQGLTHGVSYVSAVDIGQATMRLGIWMLTGGFQPGSAAGGQIPVQPFNVTKDNLKDVMP